MFIFSQAILPEEKVLSFELRYKIYVEEKGWLSSDDYALKQEHDEFDTHSVIFLAKNSSEETVGAVRIVLKNRHGIPMIKHPSIKFRKEDIPDFSGEMSRMTIARKERNGNVALGLMRIVFQYCMDNKLSYLYIVVPLRDFRVYNNLGFGFQAIGDPAMHCGDVQVPAKADINNWHPGGALSTNNPLFYKWLLDDYSTVNSDVSLFTFLKSHSKNSKQVIK